ncbi:hypothetical protein [Vibrio parahaemolyticus]|nr:hypothetical protein [Vibrio parahaemolyticus]MDG3025126.1 hypothetical protein [Vibrio parahaemolyticus]
MFDRNLLKPLETVVFINDFRFVKKGTRAVFIQPDTDSGHSVALVALLDENAESFLKENGFNSVQEHIEHKRKHCIFGEAQWYNPFTTCKPYYADIVSKTQLDKAESDIKSQIEKLQNNLSAITEYKELI